MSRVPSSLTIEGHHDLNAGSSRVDDLDAELLLVLKSVRRHRVVLYLLHLTRCRAGVRLHLQENRSR